MDSYWGGRRSRHIVLCALDGTEALNSFRVSEQVRRFFCVEMALMQLTHRLSRDLVWGNFAVNWKGQRAVAYLIPKATKLRLK